MKDSKVTRETLAIASELIGYPTPELMENIAIIESQVDGIHKKAMRIPLHDFCTWLSSNTLEQLQQNYVSTFDFSKKCSLYLTYFTHGDTRNRGSSLARLSQIYREEGLQLSTGELPDFLPVLLEFAAISRAGIDLLTEFRSELELLRCELEKMSSPYHKVVSCVTKSLGPTSKAELTRLAQIKTNGVPSEFVGLEPQTQIQAQKVSIR